MKKAFPLSLVGFAGKTQVAFRKPAKTMMGEVISNNIDAKMVILKAKKYEVTFAVEDKAKVMIGRQYETPTDLNAGNKCKESYRMVDAKNVAAKGVIPVFPSLSLMNRMSYGALYKGKGHFETKCFFFQQRSINVRVRRDEELDARTCDPLRENSCSVSRT